MMNTTVQHSLTDLLDLSTTMVTRTLQPHRGWCPGGAVCMWLEGADPSLAGPDLRWPTTEILARALSTLNPVISYPECRTHAREIIVLADSDELEASVSQVRLALAGTDHL